MSNIKKFLFSSIVVALLMILIFSNSVKAINMFNPSSTGGYKSKYNFSSGYNPNSNLTSGNNLFSGMMGMDISSIMSGISIQDILKNFGLNMGTGNVTNPEGFLKDIFGQLEEYAKDYSFEDFQFDVSILQSSGTITIEDLIASINKLPEGFAKETLNKLIELFSKINIKELLSKVTEMTSLLGKLGDLGFDLGGGESANLPEAVDITVKAKSAALITGEEVTLGGKIYKNGDSKKWAILIHPFAFTGETIAPKTGPAYYELGYNLLAIDLRGFGDSGGNMAMGFLDGLDVYDWVEYLNNKQGAEKIFIHGVSLGGAATYFAAGIDQLMEQAPENIRIDKDFKSLEELHVVGVVADCGFVDMTSIRTTKELLIAMKVGLNKENVDYYSQATNGLKYCTLPALLIHGTSDMIVGFDQAEKAKATIGTPEKDVHTYFVEGGSHAFILMGTNKDEYKTRVQNFITQYEK